MKRMATIFKWFKNVRKGPLVANVPPEDAQCEYECRVGECRHSKWLTCENRIRRMNEEIAYSHTKSGGDSATN